MPTSTREQSYRKRHESLQPLQRFGELIGQPAAIAALPRSPSQGPDNRISGDKIIGKGRLPVAIKAMAAKLARLAYRRLRFGRAIPRPRSGVLRRPAPQTANQLSPAQSRQSRVSNQRSFGSVASGEMPVNNNRQHPACYTHSEIPVGGVLCEFMFCGFWRFCWCVWRQFLAGHRIK